MYTIRNFHQEHMDGQKQFPSEVTCSLKLDFSPLIFGHSRPYSVFCCVTALMKCVKRQGELPPLQLCFPGKRTASIHGENKGSAGSVFFPFGAPTPPHLSSPTLPRVSITVSLHLSLARTGRSFLMLVHTHAQTHTHAHKYGVEHAFEHKWSIVECATHTLLILICPMLSFVNTEKSRFPCVCNLCERRYW